MGGLVEKTNSLCKADVVVILKKTNTRYAISIKSHLGASPAIINHTHRNANVWKNHLRADLPQLDILIKEYRTERKSGRIGEDVNLMNLNSMTNPAIKNSVVRTLSYFIFDGTGSRDAKIKADSIISSRSDSLVFSDYRNIYDREKYVMSLLDRIVVSLRDKSMPKKIIDYHKPWIYNTDGKHKGCLHIRVRSA